MSLFLMNTHGLQTTTTMPTNQTMSLTMLPGHNRGTNGQHRCGNTGGIQGCNVLVCVLSSSNDGTFIITETYGTLQ
jgi:hypothetical protein